MTKEVNIDWKGGSRRIELEVPSDMQKMRILSAIPTPFKMDHEAIDWMQLTIVEGSELDYDDVESMHFTDGTALISEILDHWKDTATSDSEESSDKVGDVLDGMELDDQGAVDLEDMA